ncbi:MauE/DoxX family redox-associated membrane protein [Nocardia sp. NPDC048505]|uniref:MauE/DoxX family redox-associated membrane protein n=1 Tax=unclassified Nocardia TaxID=2637762 RepID=UPI0033F939DD
MVATHPGWTALDLAIRLVVGGFLIARGVGVLGSVPVWRQVWLAVHQLAPAPLVRPIAVGLPVAETVAGILLVLGAFGRSGSIAAGLVLAASTLGIQAARARGLTLAGGELNRLQPLLSARTQLRNLVFLTALAVLATRQAPALAVAGQDGWTQIGAIAALAATAGTATVVLRRAQRRRYPLAPACA